MPEWHPGPFQGPLPASINKALLKYSHVHLFICLWLFFVIKITEILWFIRAYGSKPKIFTIWLFSGKFYWSLILLFRHSVVSDTLGLHGLQHTRPPYPSLSPRVCSNSYPLIQWCQPTISSSVAPFYCPQFFPASGSFTVSQLFTSGGHSIELHLQHQSFQWIFRVDFL